MEQHYAWYRIAHFIGMTLWLGGIAATLALLTGAGHVAAAHKDAFIAKARRVAVAMDIGATLALVFGFVMAFTKARWGNQTAFTTGGWLHVKLTLVVLGVLLPHIILRGRLARLRKNPGSDVALPAWLFPLVVVASIAIIVVVGYPTLLRK